MIIKSILTCLSNSIFNFFIKMKKKKRTLLCFPFSYEKEKRMKLLKIQRKNLLNVKMVVSYLVANFLFLIEVKAKSNLISFFNLSKTRNDTLGTGIKVYLEKCLIWHYHLQLSFVYKTVSQIFLV